MGQHYGNPNKHTVEQMIGHYFYDRKVGDTITIQNWIDSTYGRYRNVNGVRKALGKMRKEGKLWSTADGKNGANQYQLSNKYVINPRTFMMFLAIDVMRVTQLPVEHHPDDDFSDAIKAPDNLDRMQSAEIDTSEPPTFSGDPDYSVNHMDI